MAEAAKKDDALSVDDSFGSIIQRVGNSLASSKDTEDELKANRDTSRKVAESLLTRQRPEPPAPPVIPQSPSMVETDPLKAFGSFASTLAIFGSLLTRAPLTSALNASADAMMAINQRDAQSYKLSLAKWQKQSEYAFKIADYQDKRYRDILEDQKAEVSDKLAYLRAEAAANHDEVLLHQIQTGDLRLIEQTIFHREQLREKSQDAFKKISPQAQALEKYMDEHKSDNGGAGPTAEEMQKFLMGFKGPTATDKKVKAQAEANADLSKEVGQLLGMVKKNPNVVGTRGMISRLGESVEGIINQNEPMETPASKFKSALTELREKVSAAITGSKYYSPRRAADMQAILPGLENLTSPQQVETALIRLKAQLDGAAAEGPQVEETPSSDSSPSTPAPAPNSSDDAWDAIMGGK